MASPELDRAIAMFRADQAETQTFQVGIFRADPGMQNTRELFRGTGAFRSLIRWLYEIYRASKTSDVRVFLNEGARTMVNRRGCPRMG